MLITGCGSPFPAATDMNTPLPPAPIYESATPFATQNLQTPTIQPSPTPLPTYTPLLPPQPPQFSSSFSESVLLFDESSNAYRVQFPTNATRVEVNGNVSPNTEKRYVLSAMQGQTMAVWLQGYYPNLKVSSADGKTLSRPRCLDCSSSSDYIKFWRGTLPATQDYLFTVTPLPSDSSEEDFTLYIAIAPLGVNSQSFDYRDEQNGFALRYADDFAPSLYDSDYFGNTPEVLRLNLIDDGYYTNTTLHEAAVAIGVSPDISLCNSGSNTPIHITSTDSIDINGFAFTRVTGSDPSAGGYEQLIFHRIVHNNMCYEITYHIRAGNISPYYGTSVVEFDHDAVMNRMEDILASFTFIN
jgi:hypothetical protein